MKTIRAKGKYKVTFNDERGEHEVGEVSMGTVDFAGDDIDALAKEVIADDPAFKLEFRKQEEEGGIVGLFFAHGDDSPTAIMYR